MACACSHDKSVHRVDGPCLVDDGHPEYGGPDPCGCIAYVDGEPDESAPVHNCPREHGDGHAPADCICNAGRPWLVRHVYDLEETVIALRQSFDALQKNLDGLMRQNEEQRAELRAYKRLLNDRIRLNVCTRRGGR